MLVGPGQILEAERPRPAMFFREGHEFRDQAEAERLGNAELRTRVPEWVLLVMATLRELRLRELESVLAGAPGPAWQVELWEAFGCGRLAAQAAQERER